MTTPQKYPGEAVDLPLDAWLYEAHPKPGCPRCEAAAEALKEARKAGNSTARFEAARTIRQCDHGTAP